MKQIFILAVVHEIIHASYGFIRMFELYLTGSKTEQPHTQLSPPSLQFFNDRICPIRIEIIHGSHRLLEIYTWPGP